jgi:hypothetical protein
VGVVVLVGGGVEPGVAVAPWKDSNGVGVSTAGGVGVAATGVGVAATGVGVAATGVGVATTGVGVATSGVVTYVLKAKSCWQEPIESAFVPQDVMLCHAGAFLVVSKISAWPPE